MFAGRPFIILSFFVASSIVILLGVFKEAVPSPSFVAADKNTNSNSQSQTLRTAENEKGLNGDQISEPTQSFTDVLNPTSFPTPQPTEVASQAASTAKESIVIDETTPTPTIKIFLTPSPTPQIGQLQITLTPEPAHVFDCSNGNCGVVVSPTSEPMKTTICGNDGKIPQLDVCLE